MFYMSVGDNQNIIHGDNKSVSFNYTPGHVQHYRLLQMQDCNVFIALCLPKRFFRS